MPDHGVQGILLRQRAIERLARLLRQSRLAFFPGLDPARLTFVRFHAGQNVLMPKKLQVTYSCADEFTLSLRNLGNRRGLRTL